MFRSRNMSNSSCSAASPRFAPAPSSVDEVFALDDHQQRCTHGMVIRPQQQQLPPAAATATPPPPPMNHHNTVPVPALSIDSDEDDAAATISRRPSICPHRQYHRLSNSSSTTSLPTPMKGGNGSNMPTPPPAYYSAAESTVTTGTFACPQQHDRVPSIDGLSNSTTSSPSSSLMPAGRRHCVYGAFVEQKYGYHGSEPRTMFSDHPNDIRFVPCNTVETRRELNELAKEWIVPGDVKPVGAEGIFCGQITHKLYVQALALFASSVGTRIFSITPKFKPDESGNGRVKGHVEFYVESGAATKFVNASKGLVCCDDGGFWVAITKTGSEIMKTHKLIAPPVALGVPQWPITMELNKRCSSSANRGGRHHHHPANSYTTTTTSTTTSRRENDHHHYRAMESFPAGSAVSSVGIPPQYLQLPSYSHYSSSFQ